VEKDDQKPRSKFGRRFDEEFKRDAVRMLELGVRTAEQLAGELEVRAGAYSHFSENKIEPAFTLKLRSPSCL
jgi:transposase-like protein